ncbi:L,D-transpeptidase family protein [Candidatus Methylacidithermus pantelleriae]|uniref:L,D-transpeptidase family protein n=1 Tax=Candidatus Methylacidithermus pantelleriae TaxID=2744239 RepID=UPI001BD4A999|nr:L,D-transpeptidase family protein [Candidatus Methylacidithermus pantelleriae]
MGNRLWHKGKRAAAGDRDSRKATALEAFVKIRTKGPFFWLVWGLWVPLFLWGLFEWIRVFWFPPPLPCPTYAKQLLVCLTPATSASFGWIRLYERSSFHTPWKAESPWFFARVGRNGLAWGIGLHPAQRGKQKREGDGCSPAGRFRIGWVLGEEDRLPEGARWPWYHRKTSRDAWVDDPSLPQYNHLVSLPEGLPLPSWFPSQRMSLGIPARKWMILIEHNYPRSVPGAGSAIFLHAWTDPKLPSEGCTMVDPKVILAILTWLDPQKHPELVQLDVGSYETFSFLWGLPQPEDLVPWPEGLEPRFSRKDRLVLNSKRLQVVPPPRVQNYSPAPFP